MNRDAAKRQLQTDQFDICIIGAGASGAGAALDAALRGYRVALIDRGDFSGETSSRSTKLIHGGVRYLEQAIKKLDLAQLKQVRHGLAERRTVIRNAPHLAHPLGLLTPVFSRFEGLYISFGLALYDFFAHDSTFPKGQWLSRKQALATMPTLTPRMHSAVQYYDGQLNDARYALALAQSAAEAGATVANYVALTGFSHDTTGRVNQATLTDQLTGDSLTVRAKLFLNCTGPYADAVRLMANPALEPRIRPSKGVHIVLPRSVLNSDSAILIPKTPDGRVVFAIPFGDSVFVGTTDDDYHSLSEEPVLEPAEVDYLLETLAPYVAEVPKRSDVRAGFGGIRPLIVSSRADTKTLLRDHEVEHDETSGLLSLLGGKWTTYRLMAQDAIDRAGAQLNQPVACTTATHYLVGGEGYHFADWAKLQQQYNLPDDVCQHLLRTYGNRADRVAALTRTDASLADRLLDGQPYIRAEVLYQVEHEMAVTLRDVLARRWRLELADWQLTAQAAPQVADLMAQSLGWTTGQRDSYLSDYLSLLTAFREQAGMPTDARSFA
ncbi:glycerol-3-phosphate dehydrogenase/oxidase [Spirosoma rhododendri]|uniref:FAD-dependent oxidoreductase n=1 Tax=Spirosoma rhododendri TaxID=2728024 RepID=A0A7L5DMK5_9BACT|nr:FAD-dependent oxidoreductase [Spirosoma rhododendri]QJD77678.1 FAD-dependent oxidoreductase [Spirosoma rhododendri]